MAACLDCGGALPPRGVGAPRKRCVVCSPPRRSKAKRAPVVRLPAAKPEPESVYDATERALSEAGRLGTPGGQAALVLAARIDSREDSGAGIAAMVKQLQATIAEVTKDARTTVSPLDELRARRARKKAQ